MFFKKVDFLADLFDSKDWDENDTPWVKLFDAPTGYFYFFNRSTGDTEWVDGTPDQVIRIRMRYGKWDMGKWRDPS
jgi:hypothetical protein